MGSLELAEGIRESMVLWVIWFEYGWLISDLRLLQELEFEVM